MKSLKQVFSLIIFVMTPLFAAGANDTILRCPVAEGVTHEVKFNLGEVLELKPYTYERIAEVTEKIEDGDYASVAPVEIMYATARCPDCYRLFIDRLSASSALHPKARFTVGIEVESGEIRTLVDSYYMEHSISEPIKVACQIL